MACAHTGELATALIAGVDPNQIVVHGMAAPPGELCKAANAGVGRIVVDSPTRSPFWPPVCVNLKPYKSASHRTSFPRTQFVLIDGHADDAIQRALDQRLLYLVGLQCHIGSQVTDASLYGEAIRQMIRLMAEVRARHGVVLTELNIAGGHGVPHESGDPELDLDALRDFIDDALDASCATERFPRPTIVVEPGRGISARAGITLYRVLFVQSQPGGRVIVIVDGGLSDNPLVTLHEARYPSRSLTATR